MHSIEYNYAPKTLLIHGLRTMHVILIVLSVTTKIIPYPTPELNFFFIPIDLLLIHDLRFYQNKPSFKIALKDKLLNEIE
jgi:hypothetical protein